MRISVNEKNPSIKQRNRSATVYLNGHPIQRVLEADTDVGCVVIAVANGAGDLKIDGDHLRKKTLRGSVRVIFKP